MAPGQLVSSSSSSSCNWMRPDRPVVVSRGQPGGAQQEGHHSALGWVTGKKFADPGKGFTLCTSVYLLKLKNFLTINSSADYIPLFILNYQLIFVL